MPINYSPSKGIQVTEVEMRYVYRGSPPAPWDIERIDFAGSGFPVDVDLSGILPPEAANHLIHLKCEIASVEPGGQIKFGLTSEEQNVFKNVPGEPHEYIPVEGWVMCDNDRKISYTADPIGFDFLGILIRGWWIN